MTKILIVYHSQTGNTEKMAEAVAEGARSIEGVEVILKKAVDAALEDLRQNHRRNSGSVP
jgi:flavodoxin